MRDGKSTRKKGASTRAFFLVASGMIAGPTRPALAQDSGSMGNRDDGLVKTQDSAVAGAHLTPAEIEDGKVNDLYQPIHRLQRERNCAEIVRICETQVIPRAEKSQFAETMNKFLYLANRDIADCRLIAGRYREAVDRYEKALVYVSVWPGKEDPDYPILFRRLGTAEIRQEHWRKAQELLEKSVMIFETQIESAMKSDQEFVRNKRSRYLKGSQALARNFLAVAYFWNGRTRDVLPTLEKAYKDAVENGAPAETVNQIVVNGRSMANEIGDSIEVSTWRARPTPMQ